MHEGAALAHSAACSLAQYRAALSQSLYPITLDLGGSERNFRAAFLSHRLGALRLFKVHANSGFECRGHARLTSDDAYFLLQLQESGGTSYTHRGFHSVCNSDSLILMDPRKPIVGAQFGSADALIVRIPVRMLAAVLPKPEDCCSTPIATRSGSANMLATMIKDSWLWRASLTAYDQQVLPDTMLRLVGAVFCNATAESGHAYSHKSAQLERLACTIQGNLHDPDLSVDLLCHLMDVSRSTIFGLTRMAGTTVERLIIDARLSAAEVRLKDPQFADQSVTEIAFNAGFQDLSHFSRRFKQRYGESPAQYRTSRSAARQ